MQSLYSISHIIKHHMQKSIGLLIILSLSFSLQLFSQTSEIDSLEQQIANSDGERKLELMFDLHKHYQFSSELMVLSEQVKEEAIRQNNMRYLAASYSLKARYFTVNNNIDSVVFYAEISNQIYEKYKIKNPNQTYYYIGKVYINNGYYELGIHNIKKYLEATNSIDSYATLAEAYLMTRKYDLAKETILKAIDNLSSFQGQILPNAELTFYDILTIANIYLKEYEEALNTCCVMEELVRELQGTLHESISVYYKYHIYNNYANIYVRKGDVENTKKYLDKAMQMPDSDFKNYNKHETITILGEYYLLIKDYNKALSNLESALKYFKEESPDKALVTELTELKIRALEGLQKYNEALHLQKELSQHKDSIYNINMPLQILALSKDYEARLFNLEREKNEAQLTKSKLIIIALIITCLLLFLILYIVHRNSKAQKEKNLVLLRRYTEIDGLSNSQIQKDDPQKQNTLYLEIEKYMKDGEAYKKVDLTREDVAKELKTNWRYVIEAIREETGLAFLDYVNRYRLNYVRKRLLSDNTIPVNIIIFDSGFSSTSTFYRLFKAEFGMTPNEFREAQNDLKN